MTRVDRINNDYFEWLCDLINVGRFSTHISYRRLLMHLHDVEFTWFVPYDDNRADDGIQLRRRYSLSQNDMSLSGYIHGPCSVLEMMIALAIRCEETIMDDALMGDRTGQWFWGMINNLGLSPMTDSKYDGRYVDEVVYRLLNREYEPDGRGGLFTVRDYPRDMRTVEIWRQLSWYLGSIM